MGQKQVERPQEKKPRPQDDSGSNTDLEMDIGNADDILQEMDIIEHPEKYTQEQRDCGCFKPFKKDGFR